MRKPSTQRSSAPGFNRSVSLLVCFLFSSYLPVTISNLNDEDRRLWFFRPRLHRLRWGKLVSNAEWVGRAGLETVELNGDFYVIGGRVPLTFPAAPFASVILNDVWKSVDEGSSWNEIVPSVAQVPGERAFFEAVTFRSEIYIMGGQNFDQECDLNCPPAIPTPTSTFYNDVWKSTDGGTNFWTRVTAEAGWNRRAGLSAVVFESKIFVLAGAEGDDDAIGGSGRVFYNDVWSSPDGVMWTQETADAGWAGRGGAAAFVHDNHIYITGGEEGFTKPAFSDVWRSPDGKNWEEVNRFAWQPRSGHKCGSIQSEIFCFGGYNLATNPTKVQRSSDGGYTWSAVPIPGSPAWNNLVPTEVKYDFDIITYDDFIYTFGGSREDFLIPALVEPRVDNDVWKFGLQ